MSEMIANPRPFAFYVIHVLASVGSPGRPVSSTRISCQDKTAALISLQRCKLFVRTQCQQGNFV